MVYISFLSQVLVSSPIVKSPEKGEMCNRNIQMSKRVSTDG